MPTQNYTPLVVTFCVKNNADIIAWTLSKKHQIKLKEVSSLLSNENVELYNEMENMEIRGWHDHLFIFVIQKRGKIDIIDSQGWVEGVGGGGQTSSFLKLFLDSPSAPAIQSLFPALISRNLSKPIKIYSSIRLFLILFLNLLQSKNGTYIFVNEMYTRGLQI